MDTLKITTCYKCRNVNGSRDTYFICLKCRNVYISDENWTPLRGDIRLKRGNKSYREAAKEIGISHSDLLRIEKGTKPNLFNFTKLCKWLETDPNYYLSTPE